MKLGPEIAVIWLLTVLLLVAVMTTGCASRRPDYDPPERPAVELPPSQALQRLRERQYLCSRCGGAIGMTAYAAGDFAGTPDQPLHMGCEETEEVDSLECNDVGAWR